METNNQKKKRKHAKVLTGEDREILQQVVSDFVQFRIQKSLHAGSFLTCQQISKEFFVNGQNNRFMTTFFKELKKQMARIYPGAYLKQGGIIKYIGVSLTSI